MIQRLLLALALASAPIMVHAHAPATDSVEVHGKKPGFSNACSTATKTPRSGTVSSPSFAQRWNGSPCR